jgi:exosortase
VSADAAAAYSPSVALPLPVRLQGWFWPAATAVVLGAAYGPMLVNFAVNLWSRSHYQYFPFVIVAFLWLLRRNFAAAQPREKKGWLFRYGPPLLLIVAWGLLARAYFIHSPWLAMVSAIILVASLLLKLSAHWKVKHLWGIWAILWLIVPLPVNRDQDLIFRLQQLSSHMSSILLDAVAIEHLMEGNTLLLPTKQLFVDEACSGIVSVLSVIACAVIYGVWRNRSPVHVIGLTVAGVGWATIMNVVRITIIAILLDRAGIDWSSGKPHEILSLVIFSFILLGLVTTDLLLTALLLPIGPTWEQFVAAQVHFGQNVVRWWDRLIANRDEESIARPAANVPTTHTLISPNRMTLRLAPLAAFALLAGIQIPLQLTDNSAVASSAEGQPMVRRAWDCNADTLPATIGSLTRAKFMVQTRDLNNVLGAYSRTYQYRGDVHVSHAVSCDFPYYGGWHELTQCYRGGGWQLLDRRVETQPGDGAAWQYMHADFSKPDGAHGYLMASAFDDAGRPLELPTRSLVEDTITAMTSRGKSNVNGLTFQIQVWTTSGRPITQEDRDATRELFFTARQLLYRHIVQDEPPGGADKPR